LGKKKKKKKNLQDLSEKICFFCAANFSFVPGPLHKVITAAFGSSPIAHKPVQHWAPCFDGFTGPFQIMFKAFQEASRKILPTLNLFQSSHPQSFSMEISFGGWEKIPMQDSHITTQLGW
jgi:hypothetical protein